MKRARPAGLGITLFLLLIPSCPTPSQADDFDRLNGHTLARLSRDSHARSSPALSFRDLEALPRVLRDARSALLLVKTDQGNLGRMLVSPGFRKTPGAIVKLVPVLVVERFETFDAGSFGGFRLDLDTGQVVPDGLGGDLLFNARGDEDGSLAVIPPAKLSTLDKVPALPTPPSGLPSRGLTVVPADFSGRFQLSVNGQSAARLELAVDPAGAVSGTFQSESSGSVYPVSGNVDAQAPQKLGFSVKFPRSRQDFTGLLWSEGKNVLAGTASMLNRELSFIALREGAELRLAPDAVAPTIVLSSSANSAGVVVRICVLADPDRFTVDGTPKSAAELEWAVAVAVKSAPKSTVMVTADDPVSYARIRQAIAAARSAGARAIAMDSGDAGGP
jgi:biopolymer transport protein ExbD